MKHLLTIAFLFIISVASYAQNDSLISTSIDVKGITCGIDLTIICDQLSEVNGVVQCQKTENPKPTSNFIITYNKYLTSEEKIIAAIEDSSSCDSPDERPYKVKKKKKKK